MKIELDFKKYPEEKPEYSGDYLCHFNGGFQVFNWNRKIKQWFLTDDDGVDFSSPVSNAGVEHPELWWTPDVEDLDIVSVPPKMVVKVGDDGKIEKLEELKNEKRV